MRKGEVWLVDIPARGGHGQFGTRPALLATDVEAGMAVAIPCTSNLAHTKRFSRTVLIHPTKHNGLSVDSVLLIHHLLSIDTRFLLHKIGALEKSTLDKVSEEIQAYFRL